MVMPANGSRLGLEFENKGAAGLQHLINLRADELRQVAEPTSPVRWLETPKNRRAALLAWRTARSRLTTTSAAQFAENFRHQRVASGKLIVQPDVLDRETELPAR